MSRPFTLPVVIACSAHALLMFGFKKPEVVTNDKTVCIDEGTIRTFTVPLEEPPECPPAAGETAEAGKSEVPPPAAPETPPSTVSFGDIVMDPTWNGNRHVSVPTKVIPTGIYGPGGGDDRGAGPGGGKGIIYSAIGLDNPPRTRSQTPPSYPFALKTSGVSGEVLVEFVVDEHGRVVHPRVVRSTHSEFEAPTLAAVSKWRFEPGTRNMAPVRFRMVVPVKFNLNE
jgi:protein TonB